MRGRSSQGTVVVIAGRGAGPTSGTWACAPERVGKRAPALGSAFGVRAEVVG